MAAGRSVLRYAFVTVMVLACAGVWGTAFRSAKHPPTADGLAAADQADDRESERRTGEKKADRRKRTRQRQRQAPVRPSSSQWYVSDVVDGDTIVVSDSRGTQEHLRVVGIDTPERGSCGYSEASDALATKVLNREVELTAGAVDDRDSYGRILRYVDVNGADAGLAMIEGGFAVARYDSRDGYGRHPREDGYVAADAAAPDICATSVEQPQMETVVTTGQTTAVPTGADGAWNNCTDARAAGAAPVYRNEQGYGSHLDGDGDGVGCE